MNRDEDDDDDDESDVVSSNGVHDDFLPPGIFGKSSNSVLVRTEIV